MRQNTPDVFLLWLCDGEWERGRAKDSETEQIQVSHHFLVGRFSIVLSCLWLWSQLTPRMIRE